MKTQINNTILFLLLLVLFSAHNSHACYGVAVGKKASADGSVLLGHDEQNGGTRLVNFRHIPRRQFNSGDKVRLKRGGTLSQVSETYSFLWSQNVDLEWSDGYMNEWGVAVTTDRCESREKNGSLTNGGIGYLLRRLVAERAKNARHGVHVAGDFLHKFGYAASSGRTMLIADADEIWILAMVPGKHWVAQRVPDDHAIVIPNTYIIREIDLSDTMNYLGSPDLIDYARQKGWYTSGTFIFTEVYGVGYSSSEYRRQYKGQQMLTKNVVPNGQPMPFSVKPDKKMTVQDVLEIVHANDDGRTQEGCVYQLRRDLPKEIGCIYWRTMAQPRYSVLVPWYAGITQSPSSLCKNISIEKQLSLDYQFNPPSGTFKEDPKHFWWQFYGIQKRVSGSSIGYKRVRKVWDEYESRAYKNQSDFESRVNTIYKDNKDSAIGLLTEYSNNMAFMANTLAKKLNQSWLTNANQTYCRVLVAVPSTTVLAGTPASFEAFGCTNASIKSFSWDFGDSNTGNGSSPTHVYQKSGVYKVTVTLENSTGEKATDTLSITVEPNNTSLNPDLFSGTLSPRNSQFIVYDNDPLTKAIRIQLEPAYFALPGYITVTNALGKTIWQTDLRRYVRETNSNTVTWNWIDQNGSPVASGVYVVGLVVNNVTVKAQEVIRY